jgi:uncharacterized protein (TIGR03437 family)
MRYPSTWAVAILMILLPWLSATSTPAPPPRPQTPCEQICYPRANLYGTSYVERNRGQAGPGYGFYSRQGRGISALFGDGGLTLSIPDTVRALRVTFDGGRDNVPPRGEELLATRVNYFIGADPSKWMTDIPTFARIRYRDVYPGVSVTYYPSGTGGLDRLKHPFAANLEQDFEIEPGADPTSIRMRFDGADSVRVNEVGALEIRTGEQTIVWRQPNVYQWNALRLRKPVAARYRLGEDGAATFQLGDYDRQRPLVIDPVITFSTYFGRSGSDLAGRITTDAQNNIYIAGSSADPTFPVVPGTTPTPANPDKGNAVLVKMNATGSEALIVTHFGGAVGDGASAVAFDSAGNIFLTGATESPDFPVTAGAVRTTPHSGDKLSCFIVKFNATANRLLYGTYLGGTGYDGCSAIALDRSNNIYVAGFTDSRDYPATVDAFQPTFRAASSLPGTEVVVTKLNPAGTALIYSTFLGGTGADAPYALSIDAQGYAYVAGSTTSPNFPVTQGAYQTTFGGASPNLDTQYAYGDGFVSKISPDGSALVYSTYIGGREDDAVLGLAVDAQGSAYLAGVTRSVNFPVSEGALQSSLRGTGGEARYPGGDAFVVKLMPDGKSAAYATYLGGSLDDRATAIAVDSKGQAWVVGNTLSTDFPVSSDAAQPRMAGSVASEKLVLGDAFATQLAADGKKILYSTYFGGAGNDAAHGIALARDGGVLVSGATSSRNLATTKGVFQPGGGGGDPANAPFNDFFLFRIGDPPLLPRVTISSVSNEASMVSSDTVSPGEVIVITGENLSNAEPVEAVADEGGRMPAALGNTRVLFGSAAARLLAVSANRIVAVVPYSLEPASDMDLTVEWQTPANRSEALRLRVVAAIPGLYTADASGLGPVRAIDENGVPNSEASPAQAGSLFILQGTGEGQTDPVGIDGLIATADRLPIPLLQPVRAWIGDMEAEVIYAGASEGMCAGYFKIVLRVPANVSTGANAVKVRFGEEVATQDGVTVFTAGAAPPPEGVAR